MRGQIYLEVETYGGANINDTAKDMVSVSKKLGISVWTSFNGVRILAKPHSDPEKIAKSYKEEMATDKDYKIASDNGTL